MNEIEVVERTEFALPDKRLLKATKTEWKDKALEDKASGCPFKTYDRRIPNSGQKLYKCGVLTGELHSVSRHSVSHDICKTCALHGDPDPKKNVYLKHLLLRCAFNRLISGIGANRREVLGPDLKKVIKAVKKYGGKKKAKELLDTAFYHRTANVDEVVEILDEEKLLEEDDE